MQESKRTAAIGRPNPVDNSLSLGSFQSYGSESVSYCFKKEVVKQLYQVPFHFKPVILHAKICAYYCKSISGQIGSLMPINSELAVWSHFLRAAFRHLDSRNRNFVSVGKSDTEYAADFAHRYDEKNIAKIVLKYRKGCDSSIFSNLKIEDLVFLIAGANIAGIPNTRGKYFYVHVLPEQRKKILKQQYNEYSWPKIADEYDQFIKPIWNCLIKAIDMKRCIQKVNRFIFIMQKKAIANTDSKFAKIY
jgi:predicted dithiol-disulfide oxidoreductase (DUF899 family)